jgi:hypothetical protein
MEHHSEEEFAWASLILGRPLLAQRIADIVAVVRGIRNAPDAANKRISLAARGRLTVPASFAFAACQEVGSLYVSGGLTSFGSVLETEMYHQPLSNFAWNLFRYVDLPELMGQASPRPAHIAGPVDGSNRPVTLNEMRNIYASPNIHLYPEPAWDVKSLESVS